MAQIELRHATIRFLDGYSNTAQVNDTPANGDTVLDIDTLGTAEEIQVGTRFTIAGDSLVHYVTDQNSDEVQQVVVDASSGNFTLTWNAQTTGNIAFDANAATVQAALEALSNIAVGDVVVTSPTTSTWLVRFAGANAGTNVAALTGTDVDLMGGADSITITTVNAGGSTRQVTFTPAIATASGIPADDAVISFGPHTLEAKLGDGTLQYTENVNREYKLDRGTLDTVRNGDDVPMDIKLDAVWEFITAATDDEQPTFEDALKQRNLAANWVSSDSDTCAPYAVDIEIEYIPPCSGEETETILLPDFRYESLDHNAKDATISVSGKCNATEAVVTRS